MSEIEPHGHVFGGRVHGPLFDARHVLMPASVAFGTVGEAAQTEVERYKALGVGLPEQSSLIGKAVEFMGTMPQDAKAMGVACAAAAAVTLYETAKTYRDIEMENISISEGLPKESVVEPLPRRAWKRVKSLATAGAAGVVAYKTGTYLPTEVDLTASVGLMAGGAGYLGYMKKRMTGNW